MTETNRLQILHKYEILDTPQEVAFDNITKIACEIFKVQIARISFVDKDRIWCKSSCGLQIGEMPFENGFCLSTIYNKGVYVIEDAFLETKTKDSIIVNNEFGLRFYAACPITVTEGCSLGVLKIISDKPRTFNEDDKILLKMLTQLVVNLLEVRLNSRLASLNKIKMGYILKAVYNSTTEATTFISTDYKLLFLNKMAEEMCLHIFGKIPQPGDNFLEWVRPHLRTEFIGYFEQVLAGQTISTQHVDREDWYQFDFFPVYDEKNILVGVAQSIKQITDIKKKEFKIKVQNEKLRAVAWTLSHEIRSPVASILGLINLLKIENNEIDFKDKILKFIFKAAQDLDDIIKKTSQSADLN